MRIQASLGALALATLVVGTPLGAARSADMPLKAPPPPPPPVATWTGCYLGVEGGYGTSHVHDTVSFNPAAFAAVLPTYTTTTSSGGALGGAQIGCDYQWGSAWVVGLVATYDFAGINGSASNLASVVVPVALPHYYSEEIDGFGTVRGRIGWLVAPSWLVYASGGLAYGRIVTSSQTDFVGFQFSNPGEVNWKGGWTAGGGVEWKFSDHVSVFAEYLYAELGGNITATEGPTAAPIGPFSYTDDFGRNKINVVKGGINWRLW
jgi:outer membrane immunogenic protein